MIIYYILNIFSSVFYNMIIILLIKYKIFDVFSTYLLILFSSIFTSIMGYIFTIFDKDHPANTINKIYDNIKSNKFSFLIRAFPTFLLYVLANNFIDPNLLQMMLCSIAVFNYLLSIIINKTETNYKIIIAILCNIGGCILSFLSNNELNINIISVSVIIILLIINGIQYSYLETSNNITDKDNLITYNLINYMIPETVYLILFLPIFAGIQLYQNGLNLNLPMLYEIISYSLVISIILVFNALKYFESVLYLKSYEFGLIGNLSSFIIIFINCLLGFSEYKYMYIISFFIILISTIVINYSKNKTNQIENENNTNENDENIANESQTIV